MLLVDVASQLSRCTAGQHTPVDFIAGIRVAVFRSVFRSMSPRVRRALAILGNASTMELAELMGRTTNRSKRDRSKRDELTTAEFGGGRVGASERAAAPRAQLEHPRPGDARAELTRRRRLRLEDGPGTMGLPSRRRRRPATRANRARS